MSGFRASVCTALLAAAMACQAGTITYLWDDFNGAYRSGFNGFIEEHFQVGPLFATHYYIGDHVHCLGPHTGTDQAQSFQYYAESNDDCFVTYFQTNNGLNDTGEVDLVAHLAKKGQPPVNLSQPIRYRVRVYGHNDARNLSDPDSYWRQVFAVRKPSVVSAEVNWSAANNDTWQTLEVTQTGLGDNRIQWITFESWYPSFYGSKISNTSYMNWENLEIEYTPQPPVMQNVIVVADNTDFGNATAFHVEREDRVSGIRCEFTPGSTIAPRCGDRAALWGYQIQINGENCLSVNTVSVASSGNPLPEPLAMGLRAVGGKPAIASMAGPQTAGLLARVWGEVLSVGTSYFRIDDGSHVQYVPGTTGLKVYGPTTGVQAGKYVVVTGLIGTEYSGVKKVPILRARDAADIVVLN